ncbi:MAG: hypothetical protein GY832_12145 [Chloroflexi bacterium]|nr:hypothetical protein [Chloroflexota bacterium]
MKRITLTIVGLCLVIVLGWIGYTYRQPSPSLRSATPDEVGLTWQECPLIQEEHLDVNLVQACFGHSVPLWGEDEKINLGERVDQENLHLVIGQDVYKADVKQGLFPTQRYALYENGEHIHTLRGVFGAHSPNISLQNVGGKAAWEFSDHNIAIIIYDGQDIRDLYGLDNAYRPYGLADKLIFVGQKDGKFFVMYDGLKVGPDFGEIVIAYCCETSLYSVQFGQGKYLFWGTRQGQHYLVEITIL